LCAHNTQSETVRAFAGLIDVLSGSRFTIVIFACLAACGGTPREVAPVPLAKPRPQVVETKGKLETDPDLNPLPPKKLLAIDWSKVSVTSEADAVALWDQIAPTGDDYSEKLDEIPGDGPLSTQLAFALLHGGNFACTPLPQACHAPLDLPDPLPTATLGDPCLRRLLALWALGQLDDDDVNFVRDSLVAIAALPPPESQLVATAIKVVPETEQDLLLQLLAAAYAAGNRELVDGSVSTLDEAHLLTALTVHHIAGALDLLSAEIHRKAYLSAIVDEKLAPVARGNAIRELAASEAKLSKEAHAAIVKATRSPDCSVAAVASRVLVQRGEKKFGPLRPTSTKPAAMIRAMCVLASYEQLQSADEPSYLLGYIPKRGLEEVTVSYDEYSDTDDDGDGDPHTTHTVTLVPRTDVVLPEIEDMTRAFAHCKGTVCQSDEREFRFTFKGDQLTRLEVVERPPCVAH
jgi:hypothetical protein